MIDLEALSRLAQPCPQPAVVTRDWLAQVERELRDGRAALAELDRTRDGLAAEGRA